MPDLVLGRAVLIVGTAGAPGVAMACRAATVALPRVAGFPGAFPPPSPCLIDLDVHSWSPRMLERVACRYRVARRKVGPRRQRGCWCWPAGGRG